MSYLVRNNETGAIELETKRIHAAQTAVIEAFRQGHAATITMQFNGHSLPLAKLSEVTL